MLRIVLERVYDASPVLIDFRGNAVVLAVARFHPMAGVRPDLSDHSSKIRRQGNGKTWQDKAGQGRASKANQVKGGQGKIRRGRAEQAAG